jgi:hypothetical protein
MPWMSKSDRFFLLGPTSIIAFHSRPLRKTMASRRRPSRCLGSAWHARQQAYPQKSALKLGDCITSKMRSIISAVFCSVCFPSIRTRGLPQRLRSHSTRQRHAAFFYAPPQHNGGSDAERQGQRPPDRFVRTASHSVLSNSICKSERHAAYGAVKKIERIGDNPQPWIHGQLRLSSFP